MAGFKYNACWVALLVCISLTVEVASRVDLAHKCVTITTGHSKKLPVIMLHGLTSTKETWNGIYPPVTFLTGRRICMYDARNHGDSGWNDTFNADILADDLGDFMARMEIKRASLVGHSLGGLTIMKFALKNPQKVESIFVEDISPYSVTKELTEFFKTDFEMLLKSLLEIPKDADQESAEKAVADYLTEVQGRRPAENFFKIFPLRCRNGVWQWRSNLKAFLKSLEIEGYFLGKVEGRYDGRAFFIYGTKSPFKVNEEEDDIKKFFPNAEFFGVEGADHVVHANATIYINKLVHFLNDVSKNNAEKSL